MRSELFHTYIAASRTRVLYTGVTANLRRRILEHRQGDGDGFAARNRCNRLVWVDSHASALSAISREKKIALIEAENRTWEDLGVALFDLQVRIASLITAEPSRFRLQAARCRDPWSGPETRLHARTQRVAFPSPAD
jgi:putative endonuclease